MGTVWVARALALLYQTSSFCEREHVDVDAVGTDFGDGSPGEFDGEVGAGRVAPVGLCSRDPALT